jgi:hypothetical protein
MPLIRGPRHLGVLHLLLFLGLLEEEEMDKISMAVRRRAGPRGPIHLNQRTRPPNQGRLLGTRPGGTE